MEDLDEIFSSIFQALPGIHGNLSNGERGGRGAREMRFAREIVHSHTNTYAGAYVRYYLRPRLRYCERAVLPPLSRRSIISSALCAPWPRYIAGVLPAHEWKRVGTAAASSLGLPIGFH